MVRLASKISQQTIARGRVCFIRQMPAEVARVNPTAMRILLQEKETGLYLKDVGSWTPQPMAAMDFLSSTKAIDFCVTNRISGVQLVLKFEEQLHDIVLPMVTDRRYHSPQSGKEV